MRAVTPLHPLWAPPPLGVHLSTPLTSVSHAYTIESEEKGAYLKTQECGGGGRRGWSLCLKPVMCQGFIFVLKKKSLIESALFKNWLQGLCLYEPVSSLLVLQYSAFTIPLPNWPIRSRLIFCATQSQTVTLSKYTKALKKKTDIDLVGFFLFCFYCYCYLGFLGSRVVQCSFFTWRLRVRYHLIPKPSIRKGAWCKNSNRSSCD